MCPTLVRIDLNRHEEDVLVLLDTGYTSHAGHGLTLPIKYMEYVKELTTEKNISDAMGTEPIMKPFYPDTKIIKVMDYELKQGFIIPTVFMGNIPLLGNFFLQNCILHIDGHQKNGYLELDPNW